MMTHLGRVVYDRAKHAFSYEDILRIIKKVDPRTTPERAYLEISPILEIMLEMIDDLSWALAQTANELLDGPAIWSAAAKIGKAIISIADRFRPRRRRRLGKELREL